MPNAPTSRTLARYACAGAALWLAVAPASAQQASVPKEPAVAVPAGTYVADPNHMRFTWSVDHMGLAPYTARFNGPRMVLEFDPERIEDSSITVTVDPRTIDTGYQGERSWDEELATSAKYLHAPEHPTATFRSTEVVRTGPTAATVTGDLTLLGVTRPVTFDVTYSGSAAPQGPIEVPTIGFTATGTFDRTEHGLTTLAPPEPGAPGPGNRGIGRTVTVAVEAEFLKQ